jgi:hypothetical protein
VAFVTERPNVGQPPKALKSSFKSWWGGSLPAYWDLSEKDLAEFVGTLNAVLPEALAFADKHMEGAGKGSKDSKKSKKTAANAGAIIAAVAASRMRAERSDPKKSFEHRSTRASERDPDYEPQTKVSTSRMSQSEGKMVTFEGHPLDIANWEADQDYQDYTWAKKQIGEEPLSKDKWASTVQHPPRPLTPPTAKEVEHAVKHEADNELARLVRGGLKSGLKGEELKKTVSEKRDADAQRRKEVAASTRKRWVDQEIDKDTQQRFQEMVTKEVNSPPPKGFFDKVKEMFGGSTDPSEDRSKAEERVKKRLEKEGPGTRSYDDYVADKKITGQKPMEREEWENRYR